MHFRGFFVRQTSFYQFWCIQQSHSSPTAAAAGRPTWLIIGPILHLIYLTAILTLSTIYEKIIFAQGDPVSEFVDVIQLVFPVSIHIIVIIEGFFKTELDAKMRQIIEKLEDELENHGLELTGSNRKLRRKYLIFAAFVQIVSLLVEIDIIATITESPDWMRCWFAKIFSFVIGRLAVFHYLLIVEYISSRLSVLNEQLHGLQDYCEKNNLSSLYDPFLWRRVRFIKESHLKLWSLCDLHNERHSVFILGAMTSFFICLTIDFYWMYANLYYGDNIFIIREYIRRY